jgi:hypothetical protein
VKVLANVLRQQPSPLLSRELPQEHSPNPSSVLSVRGLFGPATQGASIACGSLGPGLCAAPPSGALRGRREVMESAVETGPAHLRVRCRGRRSFREKDRIPLESTETAIRLKPVEPAFTFYPYFLLKAWAVARLISMSASRCLRSSRLS